MKRWLTVTALVTAIVLAWCIIEYWRLDSEDFGARLLQQINQSPEIQIVAASISAHPLRGLELTEAMAEGRIKAGEFRAAIDRVRIRHRLLPLLWGEMVFDEIWLENPQIELITSSASEARARRRRRRSESKERSQDRQTPTEQPSLQNPSTAQFIESEKEFRISIERAEIEQANLSVRTTNGEEEAWRVEGADVELENLELEPATGRSAPAISGEGRVSTGRVLFDDIEANSLSGSFRLSPGRVSLKDVDVELASGQLRVASASVSLTREPIRYEVRALGVLDLNQLLGATKQVGFGPLSLEIEARGKGPGGARSKGKGSLRLGAGSIPPIPLVLEVEDLLGRSVLSGLRYPTTKIDFRLVGDRVALAPFEIVGQSAAVGGSGNVVLSGELDLHLYVRFRGRGEQGGVRDVDPLEALVEKLNMASVAVRVSGPLESPGVTLSSNSGTQSRPDEEASWLEEALEKARQKAQEWLEDSDDG